MPSERSTIKILVADDHRIFRDGLRKLLEGVNDVQIVGEAANGNQCVEMLA
jgi:two-component system response regulator DegU